MAGEAGWAPGTGASTTSGTLVDGGLLSDGWPRHGLVLEPKLAAAPS